MTTLCIDELSAHLKHRWRWAPGATHVPASPDCPLFDVWIDGGASRENGITARGGSKRSVRAAEGAGERCAGVGGLHGKAAPSVG